MVIDCHIYLILVKYADILLPDCTASEQMDFALDAHLREYVLRDFHVLGD